MDIQSSENYKGYIYKKIKWSCSFDRSRAIKKPVWAFFKKEDMKHCSVGASALPVVGP